MELPLDGPHLYLPDEVPAVATHEIARIEAAMPPETTGLFESATSHATSHLMSKRCSTCIKNQYTRHENPIGSD